jgi:hypothetical protein
MTTPVQPSVPYPIRYVRTPEAVEPYTIDWVLNPNDTIATSTWTCDSALQIISTSMTGATTTVVLAGGPLPVGQQWWNYHAINTITTNNGFTDQRTIVLFTKQL